jgi:heme a synthase
MSIAHVTGKPPVTLSPCHPSLSSGQVPAWLRVWSVLTACAALPLVSLGAEVTTAKVGMVDRKGFRAPWHLFILSGDQLSLGVLIEHSHRLAGFVVGMACIVLAVGMTVQARGWFHRSLGWLALAAVGLQGLLGIFRVNLHDYLGMGPTLALIHGCCAQLVFATLVAVAVLSSRAWLAPAPAVPGRLRAGALGLCALVYAQVVFGAVLRHLLDPLAQRVHVLLTFVVVLVVFWLVGRLMTETDRATRWFGYVLVGLVVLQPILGVESWIRRFGSGQLPDLVDSSLALDLARSGHHVVGTLIFSATLALALMLNRRPAEALSVPSTAPLRVEGAA